MKLNREEAVKFADNIGVDLETVISYGMILKINLQSLYELKQFLKDHKIFVIYQRAGEKLYICREPEYNKLQQQEASQYDNE
jgi:hypothetical protein